MRNQYIYNISKNGNMVAMIVNNQKKEFSYEVKSRFGGFDGKINAPEEMETIKKGSQKAIYILAEQLEETGFRNIHITNS